MSRMGKTTTLVLVLGMVLAGCGGTNLTVLQVLEEPLTKYQTLYFAAESAIAEDISQEMADLEERVISELNEAGTYQQTFLGACTDTCTGTVNVKAAVTDINKVSGSARFWGGAFAGKASMTAEVTFTDASTGTVLGIYSITGKSGGTGVSGGTESAVRRTAEAIVNLIQGNPQ